MVYLYQVPVQLSHAVLPGKVAQPVARYSGDTVLDESQGKKILKDPKKSPFLLAFFFFSKEYN